MSTRITALAAVLMTGTILVAQQPDRGTTTGSPGVPSTTLDGNWTVVSAASGGTAVDKADNMTVTIKNNTITFGGAGADQSKMRAMRLEFGTNGTVRVTEAGADGKFDSQNRGSTGGSGGTGGTGNTGSSGSGSSSGAGGTGGSGSGSGAGGAGGSGASGSGTGTMNGVYVMTQDFLAISVHAPGAASTGGTGRTGTGTGSGAGSGSGSGSGSGNGSGSGGSGQGGSGASGSGASGGGASGAGTGPQMNSHISVILKRSGATGGSR